MNAALAVVAGAFGAHGLEDTLPPNFLNAFETGAQYHFYHALALILVGLTFRQYPDCFGLTRVAWCMLVGVVVFCGSLYVLALSGITILGAVTPVGGVAFILAWVGYAVALWRA
ncbi:MAG: DUF423 domain-containing protein [Pseudomonadota bacterium]